MAHADELAAIIHSSQDAIYAKDREARITTWNRGAEELYGYPASEIVGQPVAVLIPPDRKGEEHRILERVLKGERLSHYITQRVHKDGTVIEVSLTISPIETTEGHVLGASVIARDMSGQRRADETFRALLESAPDAMVIAGTDGRIILVNRQAERIFGHSREEMVGQQVEMLVPERLRPEHGDHRGRFFLDPKMRPMGVGLDLYGVRKDGTEFPVEISLSPISTDQGLLVSAAVRDVSDRRRAQEHSRRLDEMRQRRRQALELNDEIVQGLTVALWAQSLERYEDATKAIEKTMASAQQIISQMLAEEKEDEPIVGGDLVRERGARVLRDEAD